MIPSLKSNRMFSEMLKAPGRRSNCAILRTRPAPPGSNTILHGARFACRRWARRSKSRFRTARFPPALPEWHQLVILHCLSRADGAPPGGEWIAMGQMRDGLVRGSKCDREAGARIGALLGGLSPEDAGAVCRALGGEPVEGKADFSCVLPFLPRWPVMLNLWFADDEFDGSARLLVDKTADHYLSIEGRRHRRRHRHRPPGGKLPPRLTHLFYAKRKCTSCPIPEMRSSKCSTASTRLKTSGISSKPNPPPAAGPRRPQPHPHHLFLFPLFADGGGGVRAAGRAVHLRPDGPRHDRRRRGVPRRRRSRRHGRDDGHGIPRELREHRRSPARCSTTPTSPA